MTRRMTRRLAPAIAILLAVCAWTACGAAEPSAAERAARAARLGRRADPAAVPALMEALGDPEPSVRREAAMALGFIKDGRAAGALARALGDDDVNVRFYAAYALGEIRDPAATGALVDALADPSWLVRNQAAGALREIGGPDLPGRLAAAVKKEGADAAPVLWILRHLGGEAAVDGLAALVDAPDADVRLQAVRSLAKVGAAACVEPLIRALEDETPAVRRAAVEALVAIGDERARAPLGALAAREADRGLREAAESAVLRLAMHDALVAWWSFDDGGTRAASDVTGRGNEGKIIACQSAEGKIGRALDMHAEGYVELGKPRNLPVAEVPVTVMAWVRPRGPTGVIVARGGAFCGLSLYVKDGRPAFGIHRTQEGPGAIARAERKVGGDWVHLAGVIRQDRIELHVDGRPAATARTEGTLPGNCGQGMEIGFDVGNSAAEITDPFDGLIDEVKVYHAALSAEEIAQEARVHQP